MTTEKDDAYVPCPKDENCVYCNGGKNPWAKSWSFFAPHIYCINLHERNDRFESSQKEFHRIGLCPFVTYFRTDRPHAVPDNDIPKSMGRGPYGCWRSHMRVNEKVQKASPNACCALILEDDVEFSKLTPALLRRIITYLKQTDGLDYFYLGYYAATGYPLLPGNPQVWRIYGTGTQAYVSFVTGRTRLLEGFTSMHKHEETVDIWMRSNTRQYGWFPPVAAQRPSKSSIGFDFPGAATLQYINYHAQALNFVLLILVPLLVLSVLVLFILYQRGYLFQSR